MRLRSFTFVVSLGLLTLCESSVWGQYLQFPQSTGASTNLPGTTTFRDIQSNSATPNGPVVMVPLNPATQRGIYPSAGSAGTTFDPYSTRPSYQNPGYQQPPSTTVPPYSPSPSFAPAPLGQAPFGSPYAPPPGSLAPYPGGIPSTSGGNLLGNAAGQSPYASPGSVVYPANGSLPTTVLPGVGGVPSGIPSTGVPYGYGNSINPGYPGLGTSGSIGSFNGGPPPNYPSGLYPNSSPPSLFPSSMFGNGSFLGNLFGVNPTGYGSGIYPPGTYNGGGYNAGGYNSGGFGLPNGNVIAPGALGGAYGNWNPQGNLAGSMAGVWPGTPPFVRFFQGPRFRHAFIYGNNTPDSLQINDSDLSLAFAVPNFLFSTQPLYVLPSFSLHQWDGPNSPLPADLPSKAYSAFLDAGWQSTAYLGRRIGCPRGCLQRLRNLHQR